MIKTLINGTRINDWLCCVFSCNVESSYEIFLFFTHFQTYFLLTTFPNNKLFLVKVSSYATKIVFFGAVFVLFISSFCMCSKTSSKEMDLSASDSHLDIFPTLFLSSPIIMRFVLFSTIFARN